MLGLVLAVNACNNSSNRQQQSAFGDFVGQEVQFTNLIPLNVPVNLNLDSLLANTIYKVVIYVDSSNCEDCRIYQAIGIKGYELELKRKQKEVLFIYIFNTQDIFIIKERLDRYGFHQFYFVDVEGTFLANNRIPANKRYHTFLMRKNKVQIVGNPATSQKVRGEYNKTLKISK